MRAWRGVEGFGDTDAVHTGRVLAVPLTHEQVVAVSGLERQGPLARLRVADTINGQGDR
jgi:hypothetical protein